MCNCCKLQSDLSYMTYQENIEIGSYKTHNLEIQVKFDMKFIEIGSYKTCGL